MSAFSTIGVIVKSDATNASQTLAQLLRELGAAGVDVILDDSSAGTLGADMRSLPAQELAAAIDLAIIIGGDGTLLHAGRLLAPHGVPMLGINLGRLGFMVDVLPENIEKALAQVLSGQYTLEERIMLDADLDGEGHWLAINDIVVRNREQVSMLEFSTSSDGALISHHRADGLIVATPTGSTAYSLSAGGPMMQPQLNAVALVPISPHTLSDRPLILDGGSEIRVRINPSGRTAGMFTCDGQIHSPLEPGQVLRITRSEARLRLLHPPDYDYFSILRNKLRWGSGKEPALGKR